MSDSGLNMISETMTSAGAACAAGAAAPTVPRMAPAAMSALRPCEVLRMRLLPSDIAGPTRPRLGRGYQTTNFT